MQRSLWPQLDFISFSRFVTFQYYYFIRAFAYVSGDFAFGIHSSSLLLQDWGVPNENSAVKGDGKIFLILYGTISWYFAGVMVRLMLTLAPIGTF